MTCESCREACLQIKGTEPDCEQCRPPILDKNTEAWNVANTFGIGSSENIISSILDISRLMGVHDEAEVFLKVSELISEIRSLKEI
jgi:hypothetical protein